MKIENRIKKSEEFERIIKLRRSVGCASLVIYFDINNLNKTRVGLSAGKRLGKAVKRVEVKRKARALIKEVVGLDTNLDLIVIIKEKFLNQNHEENKKDLKYLVKKIKKELEK